jgi:carboxypeptidase Q
MFHCYRSLSLLLVAAVIPAFAADKTNTRPETPDKPAWEQPQPAVESIDLSMYARIREEGFQHSHIMEYASALTDGIGPRLTGSPNMAKANAWTRDQLTAMGCANAHLDDWGEFGMGWQQLNTWVRMTAPDTAVFIAQATPWSSATNGPVTGEAMLVNIQEEKDLDQYKGKLAGKIVLLSAMREVPLTDKALFSRYSDKELEELTAYPATTPDVDIPTRNNTYIKRMALVTKVAQFLADEKAAAVIRPSRDGENGGGSGGTIFDDNGAALGRTPYIRGHEVKVPIVVAAIENYGRVYRLLQAHVPVTLEVNIETRFTGDHEHGYDTIAEIPGTDPNLKEQLVMVGGHLDSWIAGTGATDNGAGSVIAMEVMRILKTLDVHPRRTIRIALWSGEEEGLYG